MKTYKIKDHDVVAPDSFVLGERASETKIESLRGYISAMASLDRTVIVHLDLDGIGIYFASVPDVVTEADLVEGDVDE